MLRRVAISIVLLVILVIPFQVNAQELASGKLNGVNENCQIAFNSQSGNALIVWKNSTYGEENTSRIYGAELFSHPDGTVEFSEPFMISEDRGENSRPQVLFLPEFSRYVVIWDTSLADINQYRKSLDDLPEDDSDVMLRTYTPRGFNGSYFQPFGTLGELITVSGHNNIRNAFNASVSVIDTDDNVELAFFYSARRYNVDEPTFGLLASRWKVEAVQTDSDNNIDVNVVNIDSAKVITEESVLALGGAVKDGFYYLYGKTINGGGKTLTKFYKVDLETLKLESELGATDDFEATSLNAGGKLTSLESFYDEEVEETDFRLMGWADDSDILRSVNSSLEDKSLRSIENPLKIEEEITHLEFFSVDGVDDSAGTYILCALNETLLRYRKINPANGKPQGASTPALVLDQIELTSLDVEYCCEKVNIVYTVKISKKKSRVYFATFEME